MRAQVDVECARDRCKFLCYNRLPIDWPQQKETRPEDERRAQFWSKLGVALRATCSWINLFYGRCVESISPGSFGAWSLWVVGVIIPFIELIAGAMVILGLRTREALVSLGLVLAIVTFGHLLREPLYEFHTHVIPRLALLLFVLLLPRSDDRFSIDYLLERRR